MARGVGHGPLRFSVAPGTSRARGLRATLGEYSTDPADYTAIPRSLSPGPEKGRPLKSGQVSGLRHRGDGAVQIMQQPAAAFVAIALYNSARIAHTLLYNQR